MGFLKQYEDAKAEQEKADQERPEPREGSRHENYPTHNNGRSIYSAKSKRRKRQFWNNINEKFRNEKPKRPPSTPSGFLANRPPDERPPWED